jgi:CPA2 family monovalent cation:H+ antiporter-2
MHTTLSLVIILLATAVLVTALFKSLRLPVLLGYVAVGVVLGPSGFNLAPNDADTRDLAEFGIVFLMFSIGLEFSLGRLKAMHTLVFGLGGLQVLLTMAIMTGIGLLIGLSPTSGVAIGGVLAMSSTAIVSKLLADRGELDTAHGQRIMGVLLFQDLAVVPLMIFIPALASHESGNLAQAMFYASLKAAAALIVILMLGQRLMRPWFHLVAARKSAELFMLNVLFITLGLAWLTQLAGLSLALGAFVAGMLISETEYRYQVESDIRPFRDVLMGLFFVSVGMSLDLSTVLGNFPTVLLVLVLATVGKFLVIAPLARAFSEHHSDALLTALGLAQAGEFSLVLLTLVADNSLIDPALRQSVATGLILSMLIAPFLLDRSGAIVQRICASDWTDRARGVHAIAQKSFGIEGHIILCGYGRTGQSIAHVLERENIAFIALDHDPKRVKLAAAAGESVVFGNSARAEILTAAGIHRARALVISFAHTPTALQVMGAAQRLRPEIPILVRSLDDSDMETMKKAGATVVVSEVMEGALMLGSQTLMMAGTPLGRVLNLIRQMREERYSTLRGYFRGATDEESDSLAQERLTTVHLLPRHPAVGQRIGALNIDEIGAVSIVAVRRRGIRTATPTDDTLLMAGDLIILRGLPEDLAAAEIRLTG